MPEQPVPRSWRRWLRLSVRALLIIVLLLGGWLGWIENRSQGQRDAVAVIQRAGGSVVYDWQWRDGRPDPLAKPGMPEWLINGVGPDVLYRVKQVDLIGCQSSRIDDDLMASVGRLRELEDLHLGICEGVTDAGLAHLRMLTGLRGMDLEFTSATGVGLKELEGLTRLEHLELPSGPTSDADLASLRGLTNLRWLEFADSSQDITNAGLAHLRGLVNVDTLSIHSPRITSAGLVSLHEMTRLERLDLRHTGVADLSTIRHLIELTMLYLGSTAIDDAGLAPVTRLSQLQYLELDDTRVTDAGLAHIAGLSNLQWLWLDHTPVSDAGLSELAALKKLTHLFVEGTRITDTGIKEAQRTRPNLRIYRKAGRHG